MAPWHVYSVHMPRTLAVTQNITVDGSIEMLDDWFDPGAQADPELLAEIHRQDRESDALLTGRKTFESLRGFWPNQQDDTTGITEYLNAVPKYVISSTLGDPQWQNTTVLSGDAVEEVRQLKQQPGTDIVVTGSIGLCHALAAAGLVDEYRLFTYPVVQGRGRRLTADGVAVPRLKLLRSVAFDAGVTYAAYAVA